MKKHLQLLLVLVFLGSFIPQTASAATVYLEASRNVVSVGDTLVISVKIDAEDAVINTVEGDISLQSSNKNMAVQEFSLANSSFGLWPRTPSLSKDGTTISFVGGVPGGFNFNGATLFKIIVEAREAGTVTINPQNISAYQNDGNGTKVSVQRKGLSIEVKPQSGAVQNDWESVVAEDIKPPEDFVIVLGKDPAVFSGQIFAFFSAIDNQSGIDYYEVSENGKPPVRSGSTYVLQDQSEGVSLKVIAYDKAGNRKTATLASQDSSAIWFGVGVALLIGFVGVLVYRKLRKKRMNESTLG